LSKKTRLLFRKGAVDIILYLGSREEAGYYEMYKLGFVVSRQTFSNLLKSLAERGIIQRRVLDTHPPRVNYSLTEKGKRVKTPLETIIKEL